MEPSTDSHDNALTMTEELFSTPFAADILLCLKGKPGCTEDELKEAVCDGKDPKKTLNFLARKGLVEAADGCIRLTSKGEKTADILEKLESLFSDRDSQALD